MKKENHNEKEFTFDITDAPDDFYDDISKSSHEIKMFANNIFKNKNNIVVVNVLLDLIIGYIVENTQTQYVERASKNIAATLIENVILYAKQEGWEQS